MKDCTFSFSTLTNIAAWSRKELLGAGFTRSRRQQDKSGITFWFYELSHFRYRACSGNYRQLDLHYRLIESYQNTQKECGGGVSVTLHSAAVLRGKTASSISVWHELSPRYCNCMCGKTSPRKPLDLQNQTTTKHNAFCTGSSPLRPHAFSACRLSFAYPSWLPTRQVLAAVNGDSDASVLKLLARLLRDLRFQQSLAEIAG